MLVALAILPPDSETGKFSPAERFRLACKRAYLFHSLLAGAACLVLAMTIHLWAIQATPEVVGGGIFLLVMWLGLPVIFLLSACLYYSCRARSEWPLIVLGAVALAMTTQWLIGVEPAVVNMVALEAFYIILTGLFFLRWRSRNRRDTPHEASGKPSLPPGIQNG
jgi:hypothetical protein